MRLRTYDEYYDPAKLAEGRRALDERLSAFLDARVEGDGDGWPPVSRDDHSELIEIFNQIISLKWGTDADLDLPINFVTVNRNEGRLISDVIPYSPNHRDLAGKTPDEVVEIEAVYQMNLLHSLSYLTSAIQTEMNSLSYRASHKVASMREERERVAEAQAFIDMLDSREDETHYQRDKAEAIRFSKEVLGNDGHTMQRIQSKMVEVYPNALATEINHIIREMKRVEDDEAPGYDKIIRQPRTDAGRTFGSKYTTHPEVHRLANEHYQKGYAKRSARRLAARNRGPV